MKQNCYKEKQHSNSMKALLTFVLSMMMFVAAIGQERVVTGVVSDQSGATLPGVNVTIKGTTTGTVTDVNGKYSIKVPESESIINFSFVGYVSQDIKAGEQTAIDVSLSEDVTEMSEVVVVGYGVQKKSNLTGAIASVSSEKLTSVPIPSVEHALQGMAAGVNIISRSGKPGEEASIQIRGISSLNGSKPLVIIDGVSGSLSNLNPADVASIEVLKDASSAAIYGATGGNGVILVTTKKGTAGKMKVDVNYYQGVENAVGKLDLMNAREYTELLEEINKKHMNTQPDTLQTYDWQDMVIKPSATKTMDVSISGGNDVSTFLFSSSLFQQDGIVKNTDYQRFTMRLNSDHKVKKWLTFDEKVSYVNSETSGFDTWAWHDFYNNPLNGIFTADPTVPDYEKNGKWSLSPNNVGNPLPALDMKDKIAKNNEIEGNFGAKITLFKGFEYQSRINGKIGLNDDREYKGIYWASPTDKNEKDELTQSMKKNMSWNFQNYISYNITIANDHNISAMAGMEASKWWWYDINGTRTNMASNLPDMLYLSKSLNDTSDLQNVKGTADNGVGQAYFGRLNYDYAGRYLFSFNVRRDGSNSFGPNYRWGNFPSFSFGWKFSEEQFMKDIPYLSMGKLRVGWGSTGANAKTGFPYLASVVTRPEFRYTVNGNTTMGGVAPNQIANPDIHWEAVKMTNIGLDLAFFENRITLSVDAFEKVNDDMILSKEVGSVAGTFNGQNPEVNIGSISNKGLEFSLGARKRTGELTGSIDANITFVKNEVVSLTNDSLLAGSVHTISPTNITMEGQPIAQFYGYYIEGMFSENDPTEVIDGKTVITNQPFYVKADGTKVYDMPKALPGDARFKDITGDGKVGLDDKVLLGSPLPKFTFGFSLNLEYKGFDFNAFFNGTYGNKIMNGSKQYLYNPVGAGNRGKEFANRYRDEIIKDGVVVVNENHNTDVYRWNTFTYTRMSQFFVEDGSYLRLKNMSLGYTIPKSITEKIGIERLRIYGGGKNLLTLTKYTGLNPEVTSPNGSDYKQSLTMGVDLGVYPVTKMWYFGVNLTF